MIHALIQLFRFVLLFCIVISFSSCESLSSKKTDIKDCIVTYKDDCLDKKEIQAITEYYNKSDSERIAKQYARDWIINAKLYEEAEKTIVPDEAEIQKLVTGIKKQYFITEYLKKYVQENMDTAVTNKEILMYYQQHKDAFKLTNNIAQIFYVKLNDNEQEINEYKKLLFSNKKSKSEDLRKFVVAKASSYFIEDSVWLKWDDILKEMPVLKTYDINYLPKGKTIEWKDGTYYYYIKIIDYKVKNEYSPVVYEKEKIKKIILDDRKNKLINELKNQLLSESGLK